MHRIQWQLEVEAVAFVQLGKYAVRSLQHILVWPARLRDFAHPVIPGKSFVNSVQGPPDLFWLELVLITRTQLEIAIQTHLQAPWKDKTTFQNALYWDAKGE
eukprot:TRINITY_DN11827_c0_g1_i1.p3 TRINITY_DN11827_c0_g1~~TRINITY_DN11827_c0_g1_i1.p3  ORF type:complete len:102 (-),score=5.66 TRINITY_DN11827_c0_g1_i1:57-362(-)